MPHFLFLNASTRETGHIGHTEWLARQAAAIQEAVGFFIQPSFSR